MCFGSFVGSDALPLVLTSVCGLCVLLFFGNDFLLFAGWCGLNVLCAVE